MTAPISGHHALSRQPRRLHPRQPRAADSPREAVSPGCLAREDQPPARQWRAQHRPRAGRPKRYDTHFFLAPMPTDQKPQGDGHETVHTIWISPDDAIAGGQSKRFTVVFATRLNLGQLAQDTNVATAMARAAASTIVTVCPEMLKIEGRRILRLPLEAGYGGPDFDADDIPIP